MEATLENIFNLYVLSTGRRTFALQQMKPIAADLEHKGLVTLINRAGRVKFSVSGAETCPSVQ